MYNFSKYGFLTFLNVFKTHHIKRLKIKKKKNYILKSANFYYLNSTALFYYKLFSGYLFEKCYRIKIKIQTSRI